MAHPYGTRRIWLVLARHEGNIHEDYTSEENDGIKWCTAPQDRSLRIDRIEIFVYRNACPPGVYAVRGADRLFFEHVHWL